jgi:hypothetical protein
VNVVANTIPKIYVALKDQWKHHWASVVEVDGKIVKKAISILIDPESSHRYIDPYIVDTCILQKIKHKNYWLV